MIWATVIRKLFGKFRFNFWSFLLQNHSVTSPRRGDERIKGGKGVVRDTSPAAVIFRTEMTFAKNKTKHKVPQRCTGKWMGWCKVNSSSCI